MHKEELIQTKRKQAYLESPHPLFLCVHLSAYLLLLPGKAFAFCRVNTNSSLMTHNNTLL